MKYFKLAPYKIEQFIEDNETFKYRDYFINSYRINTVVKRNNFGTLIVYDVWQGEKIYVRNKNKFELIDMITNNHILDEPSRFNKDKYVESLNLFNII